MYYSTEIDYESHDKCSDHGWYMKEKQEINLIVYLNNYIGYCSHFCNKIPDKKQLQRRRDLSGLIEELQLQ